MADSAVGTFGKVVLGGAVGFALYLLSGLGGRGRGDEQPSAPPRPRDVARLSFVMVEPQLPGRPAGFRLRGGDPMRLYASEELVSRVREGGRSDVELAASGAVIQSAWDDARGLVEGAGIAVHAPVGQRSA